MNLADTQITFLCIISVRNGSVCKEMSEKWGQQKKPKEQQREKRQKRTSSQNFLRDETIKMPFFPPQELEQQDKSHLVCILYIHLSVSLPFLHPKLHLIAPISVGKVNPCC